MWRVAAAKCCVGNTEPDRMPQSDAFCFPWGIFFFSAKMSIPVPSRIVVITIKYSTYVINMTVSLLTLYLLSENVMVKTYRNMVHVLRTTLFELLRSE
jgi:hypothetical protein